MLSVLLAASVAAAGIRDRCDGASRVSVGTDVLTLYDSYLGASWFLEEPGWDGMWTTGLSAMPCLRLGVREHAFLSLIDLDPGAAASGWELQNKLSAAVGSELSGRRWSVGGYLLPGARLTVVRQVADYPDAGIDQGYTGVGLLPSLYLYQVSRVWITRRVGLHVDLQWSPIFPYREYGWYSNRVLGVGLSFRPPPPPA